MHKEVKNDQAMKQLGETIAHFLRGGEVIELIGDVGAGKTTLTKGIGAGLGVTEDIQSPSFTISRSYDLPGGLRLAHYDFYRLHDAGIMHYELAEAVGDATVITIIEWADAVKDVLPAERLQIHIAALSEEGRQLELIALGKRYEQLARQIAKEIA